MTGHDSIGVAPSRRIPGREAASSMERGSWASGSAWLCGIAACAVLGTSCPARATDPIERGRYLVATGGCGDCHTPLKMGKNGPEPDTKRLLAGHPEALVMPPVPKLPPGPWSVVSSMTNTAWAGPWGVSYTANLTPDPETGLGQWTSRQFIETMHTGRHLGIGRAVLPPMPIPAYKNFQDADLEAIFSYLKSIPAVKNRVPPPTPPRGATAASKIKTAA